MVIERSVPAMAMAYWVFCLGSEGRRGVTEKAVADLMDLWSRLRRIIVPLSDLFEISRRSSSAPVRSG